jgi:hypothetical protein
MKMIFIAVLFLLVVNFPWAQNQKHVYSIVAAEKNIVPDQAKDWTGTWQTNWGAMILTQRGDTVEGEYEHDSGKIKGILSKNGKVVRGRWSESPSYKAPNDAGDIEFTLTSDNEFTGKWKYGSGGSWSTWTGSRKQ